MTPPPAVIEAPPSLPSLFSLRLTGWTVPKQRLDAKRQLNSDNILLFKITRD